MAKKNRIKIAYLKQGDRIKDGAMEFLCLHPEKGEDKWLSSEDRNNQSLVLLIKYHSFDMLLTGDIEEEGEKEMLEYVDLSGLEVLKVAHHGSSGSSHEEFLEVFTPKLSLISCGKNNSYGHPHEETLERLEAVGSEVISTVDGGAITLKLRHGKVIVKQYKD